jgi:hypothetical protein
MNRQRSCFATEIVAEYGGECAQVGFLVVLAFEPDA